MGRDPIPESVEAIVLWSARKEPAKGGAGACGLGVETERAGFRLPDHPALPQFRQEED